MCLQFSSLECISAPQVQPFVMEMSRNCNVIAYCKASGEFPLEFIWTLNGTRIKEQEDKNVAFYQPRDRESVLFIINVTRDNHGTYECTAKNALGEHQQTAHVSQDLYFGNVLENPIFFQNKGLS